MSAPRLAALASEGERLDWEEIACPLCGSESWTPVLEAPDQLGPGLRFLVVRCQECTLCFTNPRPSPASIGRFYPDEYKPHHKQVEQGGKRRWWQRLFTGRNPRKGLPLTGQGRLLDFGCGGGSYLIRMQRLGWNVTGLDFSQATVERLRGLGLTAYQGSLPHPDLLGQEFDAITMWQSLEHVHDPLAVLQAARQLLAKDGTITVALHNIESLPFRWFGPAWFALDLPRHLTHFSPTTLRQMMQRAGFHPGPVRMVRNSSWLRQSAHIARRMHLRFPRWAGLMRSRLGSNVASWYCYLTRSSDSMLITATR